ncbi:MAG TPA: sigma-70 family RNA polymerase sigma factor [Bryobacteraceae bacterium]|jgi:RNA polymerase sigma-70 factor (ECF subfamily)|nr:sigma-70 family RNA polymerase sigma factor [Bryobacteraceae bacterium]
MGQPLLGNSGSLSILAAAQGSVSEEDARIVRGLRAGIEEAYEELIDRFQQPVYGMVYRLLDNPSDAADVVQDVFLKVFRNIHSFREQSSLRTWIYRIAVNEAHNQRRWFSRHCRREVPLERERDDDTQKFDIATDHGPSPFHLALDGENRMLIEQALARVKPAFRMVVVLRDIENFSYEEIAEILQLSLGTVKSRIVRGREALRRELTQRLNSTLAQVYT